MLSMARSTMGMPRSSGVSTKLEAVRLVQKMSAAGSPPGRPRVCPGDLRAQPVEGVAQDGQQAHRRAGHEAADARRGAAAADVAPAQHGSLSLQGGGRAEGAVSGAEHGEDPV